MPMPRNLDEMTHGNWTFKNHGLCSGCGETVEWWENPEGFPTPFNPMEREASPAVPHRQTCTDFPGRK